MGGSINPQAMQAVAERLASKWPEPEMWLINEGIPHPPISFTGKVVWSDPVIEDIRAKAAAVMEVPGLGFADVATMQEIVAREDEGHWWCDLYFCDAQAVAALLLALHEAFHGF